jgi:hypothetical protein
MDVTKPAYEDLSKLKKTQRKRLGGKQDSDEDFEWQPTTKKVGVVYDNFEISTREFDSVYKMQDKNGQRQLFKDFVQKKHGNQIVFKNNKNMKL